MNRIYKTLISLFAVLAMGAPLGAQNAQFVLDNTTLNGAITSTATSVTITSATLSGGATTGAIAAGMWLMVEGEVMQIRAVSGTTLTVSRSGLQGTSTAAHPTSAVVFIGPPSYFQQSDPSFGKTCSTTTMQYRPWINTFNANVWLCKSSVWTATNYKPLTVNSVDPY